MRYIQVLFTFISQYHWTRTCQLMHDLLNILNLATKKMGRPFFQRVAMRCLSLWFMNQHLSVDVSLRRGAPKGSQGRMRHKDRGLRTPGVTNRVITLLSLHPKIMIQRLNQQNARYISLDIYITVSHWIFWNVSIRQGPSSANQSSSA